MKKNKYKLLFLMGIIVLTGCQANYNVKIGLDGQVVEEATIIEEKDALMDTFTKDKFNQYVDDYLKQVGLNTGIRQKKVLIQDTTAGVKISKSYRDIQQYIAESKAINYLFKKINVEKSGNKTLVSSVESDYDVIYLEDDDEYNFTNSQLSIALPYMVINSNADEVDKKNNIYTWNIDNKFKGIELEYYNSRFYTNNIFNLARYGNASTYVTGLLVIMIVTLIVGVITMGLIIEKKQKNN